MIALQRTLDRLPGTFRPAISIAAARVAITTAGFECNEDLLEDLLDKGHFEWAWNIAGPTAACREVRIFEPCVTDYIAWLKQPAAERRHYAFEEVARALFPGWKQLRSALSSQLTLAFVCGPTHVTNLINAGVLAQFPGTKYGRGSANAAQITWASLETFLSDRRI